MKFRILLVLTPVLCSVSFFSPNTAHAQSSYSIKGAVADTTTKAKLVNATITVLNAKDSILHDFTRTQPDGTFGMNSVPAGEYILLVTYQDYADFVRPFTTGPANAALDLGQINLILKAKLLAEVVISAGAITIKGDTTVFNASSYKVQANARVEDLLKQMPGLQVDQQGRVTAHGQAVQKILVDGEEFFGNDPTLVTKNIRADMVSRVELSDQKSDQVKATGVDDGQRTKTLNVILKDNSKNGYFGKVEAGETTDLGFYMGQGLFNSFTPITKVSFYGTVGNTSRTGLSGQDASRIGAMSGIGGVIISDGGAIEVFGGGAAAPAGLPTSRSGGLHFDSKWNKNKETINLNYTAKYLGTDLVRTDLSQNNLPDGTINGNDNTNKDNTNSNQRVDLAYVGTYNPNTILRISANGSMTKTTEIAKYLTVNTKGNNVMLNRSNRTNTSEGDQKSFGMNANLTKRFKKAGRSLSAFINQSINDSKSTGYFYSLIDFYNSQGVLTGTSLIDQYKPTITKSSSFSTTVSYTEPLSKTLNLNLGYGVTLNKSTNDRESFDKSASGKYDVHDNVYSNNFDMNLFTNRINTGLNYNKNKTTIFFSAGLSAVDQKQTDLNTSKEYNRNYINLSSIALYSYRISPQKSLSVQLGSSSSQPSIEQIQPVKVNTNPLFITEGNPNLKPSFSNSMFVSYSSTKPLSGSSLRFSGNYSMRSNVIVQKTTTDVAGKTTIQWVNLTDRKPMSYSFNVTTGNKLKKSDVSVNLSWITSGSQNFSYANGSLTKTQSYSFNFAASALKTKVKKYDFNMRFAPGYKYNVSSAQNQVNNSGWIFSSQNTLNIYVPGKVQLGTVANYSYTQKTAAFPENSTITLDGVISKKFFQKENLIFSLSGNDLLNQNVGFVPNSSNNNIFTQTYNNTINRYLMFSVAWDFTKPAKKGEAAPAPGPGAQPFPPGVMPGGAVPRPAPGTAPAGTTPRPAPTGTPPAGGAPRTMPVGTPPAGGAAQPTTTPQN